MVFFAEDHCYSIFKYKTLIYYLFLLIVAN